MKVLDELIRPREPAEWLCVNEMYIYKFHKIGAFTYIDIDGTNYIHFSEVEKWINDSRFLHGTSHEC